jgi:hypothetical protein
MSVAGALTVTDEISGGSYNLTGGTGISFSGVTITNTGIISASAGDGITVSGTNPLTIAMSGSYSGSFAISGTLEITNGTSADGNDISVNFPVTLTASSGGEYFSILSSINGGVTFNFYGKYSTNSSSNLSDAFVAIYDYRLSSDLLHLDLFSGSMGSYKNTLDNGSGDMTVAGGLTVNGGATMNNVGVAGVVFEGDASDPSILISDTQNSTYTMNIGQASANGSYFSNCVIGDSIIRGNSERLLLGAINSSGEDAGLILTNTFSVTTKNSTLDDGSGNMSVAGGLSVSDTTVLGHSGGNNGVTIYAYTPDNVLGRFGTFNLKGEGGLFISSAADNGLDYGFFMVEDQNSGQFGFYNLGSTTYNGLGGSKYTISLLTTPNGLLQTMANQNTSLGSAIGLTARNILDDGSGNMSIAGTATGGFAQFFNSGTIRVSVQALSYSITLPAGTWAGFITVGIFFVPSSSTYSYQIGVNFSGSAFVSGTVYGSSALTNIAGGSGQNYPLDDFPPIPLEIESSGGTITFNIVDLDGTVGMTSIFGGNTDNAFQVNVFLVSTSTAS